MLIICEPQCSGFEHAEFNAALVAAFRAGFPSEQILFLAEKEHWGIVRDKLAVHGVGGVDSEIISVPPRSCPSRNRYLLDLSLMRRVFARAAVLGVTRLIFCSVSAPGLLAVKLNLAGNRKVHCVVVPHGILEEAVRRPLLAVLRRPLMFRYALAVANCNRLRYLVLGEPLRDELLRHLPRLGAVVCSIDHPYFFNDLPATTSTVGRTVRFGFLGVGAVNKGILNMAAIARVVCSEQVCSSAEFWLVGHPENVQVKDSLTAAGVNMTSLDGPLGRDAFEGTLASLHYALFPCDSGSYALRASGTFLDALSRGIPVIAMRTPLFSYYFERLGDIGYLCDSIDGFTNCIRALAVQHPSDRYDRQRKTILNGRDIFAPASVGKQLAHFWQEW